MQTLIVQAFVRGGVNTVSWHMQNPLSGHPYHHCAKNTVARILPGGDRHSAFKEQLDWAADFFHRLKTDDGISVPIIFRPFHEHTHNGFWWNLPHCTEEQYRQLWRFTVAYLRDDRQVHNLLWAISPSGRCIDASRESYLKGYPGDRQPDRLFHGLAEHEHKEILGSQPELGPG